jgi:SAM-dependent methyltransferase
MNGSAHVLDLGAGAGIVPQMNFKGAVEKVSGIDPDKRVVHNPFLDNAVVGYGESMPQFENGSIDVVISDNVLEHIGNPVDLFKEIHRVLKPGGYFISKSPNKYYYVAAISKFTPYFIHKIINKKRGRKYEDTFPTHYKLNTKRAQLKHALNAGFEVVEFFSVEGRPEYLRHFGPAYLLGIAYERLVNKLNLDFLKAVNISVFRKQ